MGVFSLERKLKQEVRLYDIAAGDGRLYRLSYPNRWLVPAQITEDEELAIFEYNLEELEPLEYLRGRPVIDRLRLLINIAQLEGLTEQYSFSVSPKNLYIDRNLEPMVLTRDLTSEDNRHNFVQEYIALASTLLAPKYSFEDYLEGGNSLCKNSDRIKELPLAGAATEIRNILKKQYEREEEIIRTQKILIDRRQRRFLQIVAPVCFVLFLVGAGFALYMHQVVLAREHAMLTANRAFLQEDFDRAIDALRPIDPMQMEREERFQLARAYIIAESLSPEQRAHILSGITLMTEDNILIYWISIGRMDYYNAIDIAMRVGDDELLLYALVKYEVSVQMDATRPGEERVALLADLNRQIDALRRNQEERREAVEESLAIDDVYAQEPDDLEAYDNEEYDEETPEDGGESQ